MSRASAAPPVLLVHGLIGAFDVAAGLPRHAAPPLLGYGEHQATPPARKMCIRDRSKCVSMNARRCSTCAGSEMRAGGVAWCSP